MQYHGSVKQKNRRENLQKQEMCSMYRLDLPSSKVESPKKKRSRKELKQVKNNVNVNQISQLEKRLIKIRNYFALFIFKT